MNIKCKVLAVVAACAVASVFAEGRIISVNFGDNMLPEDVTGYYPAHNWLNVMGPGTEGCVPEKLVENVTLVDSTGNQYPDVKLYLASRGDSSGDNGMWSEGDGESTDPTKKMV